MKQQSKAVTLTPSILTLRELLQDYETVEIPLLELEEFGSDVSLEYRKTLIRSRCAAAIKPLRERGFRLRTYSEESSLIARLERADFSDEDGHPFESAQPVEFDDGKPPRRPILFYGVMGVLHLAEMEDWLDYEIADAILELVGEE